MTENTWTITDCDGKNARSVTRARNNQTHVEARAYLMGITVDEAARLTPGKRPQDATVFVSKLWPDITGNVWSVGDTWFARCWSIGNPEGAKTKTFASRDEAEAHVKLVLAL